MEVLGTVAVTLCGVLHLQEGIGAGRFAVGEGGDRHRGDHGPPLTLLHLHPHLLQQLVIQSVGDVKLSVGGGGGGGRFRERN